MIRIPALEEVYGQEIEELLAVAELCLKDSSVTQLSSRRRCEAAYEAAAWFAIAVLVTSDTRHRTEQTDVLLTLCREGAMVLRVDEQVRLLTRLCPREIFDGRNTARRDADRAYQAAKRIGTVARWWLQMHKHLPSGASRLGE